MMPPCEARCRTSRLASTAAASVAECPISGLGSIVSWGKSGVAQLAPSVDVYVLDFYEEVRVGVLIRWLFRLVLFRVLVGLWRLVRRR